MSLRFRTIGLANRRRRVWLKKLRSAAQLPSGKLAAYILTSLSSLRLPTLSSIATPDWKRCQIRTPALAYTETIDILDSEP
jgi:hypothetical protein